MAAVMTASVDISTTVTRKVTCILKSSILMTQHIPSFSPKSIEIGEECTYNYGPTKPEYWWRTKRKIGTVLCTKGQLSDHRSESLRCEKANDINSNAGGATESDEERRNQTVIVNSDDANSYSNQLLRSATEKTVPRNYSSTAKHDINSNAGGATESDEELRNQTVIDNSDDSDSYSIPSLRSATEQTVALDYSSTAKHDINSNAVITAGFDRDA